MGGVLLWFPWIISEGISFEYFSVLSYERYVVIWTKDIPFWKAELLTTINSIIQHCGLKRTVDGRILLLIRNDNKRMISQKRTYQLLASRIIKRASNGQKEFAKSVKILLPVTVFRNVWTMGSIVYTYLMVLVTYTTWWCAQSYIWIVTDCFINSWVIKGKELGILNVTSMKVTKFKLGQKEGQASGESSSLQNNRVNGELFY